MTEISVDLRRPSQDGVDVPASGTLECVPTLRRAVDTYIVLPDKFNARLVDGQAALDLAPSEPTWCWAITERTSAGGGRRYFEVPDSDGPILYADLVEVDPTSFDPIAPPSPAWLSTAENLQEQVDSKAATTALDALTSTVSSKASQADLDALTAVVGTKVAAADVNGLVDDALDTYTPGTELAYAEIHSTSSYAPYSNTLTSVATTGANVTGLTISFTGTGRPVIVTLAIGIIWHSVANTKVSVGLAVNGVIATAPGMIGSAYCGAAGSSGAISPPVLQRRISTVAGQTYTIDARVSGAVAGTTSVGITNTPYVPSSLRAVAC